MKYLAIPSLIATVTMSVGFFAAAALADVSTTFIDEEWQSWVDSYATIDFIGFPNGTPISNQYAGQGVIFTGPAFIAAGPTFVNDGWGLHGPSGLHVYFDLPQSWVSIHHAGNAFFVLFLHGETVGTSGFDPVGGIGSFLGITSSVPFDEVIITKPPLYGTHIFVDDLHWGSPIPGPGALEVFIAATLFRRRRRTG